jgi:SAM-dependent methyltransferase
MMFGSRESFDYLECSKCGTLQIVSIPEDMSPYYPANYYSFKLPRLKQNPVRTFLRYHRALNYLGLPSILGHLAAHKESQRPVIFRWLKAARVNPETPILDVGCGSGGLLAELSKYGFRDLTGIDPFLAGDVHFTSCFRVLRKDIEKETRRYPLVMLHHSFEHMADPLQVLRRAKDLLTDAGTLLIRIPLAGTFACRHYGRDWVQLDAPRHLFLYTERSMGVLASAAGLRVREVIYDSEAFQFWGSEQVKRDIPLTDPRSYGTDPSRSIFTPREIQAFAKESIRLNSAKDGDQACFFLER